MLTMSGVVPHGRTIWDSALFPDDEQRQRLQLVQAALVERELDALVVFGNNRSHADLMYLGQMAPLEGFALAIVPTEGELSLLGNIFALRDRGWSGARRTPLDGSLREVIGDKRRLGLVGFDVIPAVIYDRLFDGVPPEVSLSPADDLMRGLRRSLRPREISAVREAAGVLDAALAELASSYQGGASNSQAVIDAERVARSRGAIDVQTLVSRTPAGEMMPIQTVGDPRLPSLTAYLALEYLGYRLDASLTLGAADPALLASAGAALQAMRRHVRPGITAGQVAQAAMDVLDPEQLRVALRDGLGNAAGLDDAGQPLIAHDNQESLVKDMALSLRVHLANGSSRAVVSDIVLVGANGATSLLHRPSK